MNSTIQTEIEKSRATIDAVLRDNALLAQVEKVVAVCVEALKRGNKILFCGNGGSAADSQHLAAELVSRLNYNRPGLASVALTTDTSALTAIGNDYGFENVFSRQIQAIGNKGDVLIAISTSGNSPNVLKALEAARQKGIAAIGKTGSSGGKMKSLCDICLCMPSQETPKIQECHMMLGHIYCAMIEDALFEKTHKPKKDAAA